MDRKYWEFKAATPKSAELYLYGEIGDSSVWGDEITPAAFQKDLAALGQVGQLDVFINSPGGSVFAGITMYNVLKRHNASKTVHVDGIAASAASVVAMAGDKIIMPRSATLMIHNAWGASVGNKAEMRKMADELECIDGQIAGIYAERTGNKADDVTAWMNEELWMSGEEALQKGFTDEIEEKSAIAACISPEIFAKFKHPPEGLTPTEAKPETAQNGGFSLPAEAPQLAVDGADFLQPVSDIPALVDQRKHFDQIRRKIMGG